MARNRGTKPSPPPEPAPRGASSPGDGGGPQPAVVLVLQDGSCWSVDAHSPIGRALRALADVLALRPAMRPASRAGRSAAGVR